jgi:subtilisin family serine protease
VSLQRRYVSLGVVLTIVSLFASAVSIAPAAASPRAAPGAAADPPALDAGLVKRFAAHPMQTFVVEFSAKANLAPAYRIEGFAARGAFALNSLRTTAARSQDEAARVVARTPGAVATSYWIVNEMVVRGRLPLARALASLSGVAKVRAPKGYRIVRPVHSRPGAAPNDSDPEWGIAKIGADQVWQEGILGQGVVVASVDTGVDYTHPALVHQYRGNEGNGNFDHNYNWWDPTGVCGDVPCDNVAHGTHTMGTMVGGDGPGPFTPDIGVAPEAKWIAAKGCLDFGCDETDLISAGQFLLAPTDLQGQNPDPSKRPDLINNSWGSDDPFDTFYAGVVDAWRAAGIVPVFAIGNNGYGFCGSAGTPGNFANVLGVGATDINDNIAEFSSLGPAPDGRVKPDVSAPGVNVTSSVPGGGYEAFDGTSMATPHVAGTIALMISAKQNLRGQYDALATSLDASAVDRPDDSCGGDPDGDPNNVYGDGRIDALAAVDLVKTGGTLMGTVTDAATTDPIAGATVLVRGHGHDYTATTDPSGAYELFLAAGKYHATASAFGYEAADDVTVKIKADQTTVRSFALEPLPRHVLSGTATSVESGKPLAGVKVQALGTPVPPAYTDGHGAYALTLPEGSYSIEANIGGCTDTGSADVELDQDVVQDFALLQKVDGFGHGCDAQQFVWVNAKHDSGLYGDEFAGHLSLPFAFSFYGTSYSDVFISDNGYINFLGPDQYNGYPFEIPDPAPPNAAIYAMWQDMFVGAGGSIRYQEVGGSKNKGFVIEYSNVTAYGASDPISFEIKLWQDGSVDLVYGDNPADAGNGGNALVGIENGDGTDAFEFSFYEPVLGPNESYRFHTVPTGTVQGTVTDANDGQPIAGATVSADPGGRSVTTGADGTYSLTLRPGHYTVSGSLDPYTPASRNVHVKSDANVTADFALTAPAGSVDPGQVSASVGYGKTTNATVTLSNGGTAPLDWAAAERPPCPPPPPVQGSSPGRAPAHAPRAWPKDRRTRPSGAAAERPASIPPGLLCTITADPLGDGVPTDVTTVRAASLNGESTVAIDFAPGTDMSQVVGYVLLDTDQNPATGPSPEEFAGLPTQDIGVDYFADLFGIHDPEPSVYIWDANTGDLVAQVPVTIGANTISFDIPLDAIGDDGNIDTDLVIGDFFQPWDWAPDAGHGTITGSSNVPWLKETPSHGSVDPGQSADVAVKLGSKSLQPGEHAALIAFSANDPKHQLLVDVDLTVTAPAEFGQVQGTVTDLMSGQPLAGATVAIDATWKGKPLTVKVASAADGTYSAYAPEGTWPIHFSAEGHVTVDSQVTIVHGQVTTGVDAALDRDQAHATLDGGPFTFYLTPGRQASGTMTLGNVQGHEELTFTTGEVDLGGPGSGTAPRSSRRAGPAGQNADARTTKGRWGPGQADATRPQGAGQVLKSWPTGMSVPWGVSFNGDVALSDAQDVKDVTFDTDGNRLSEFPTSFGEWPGDMAWDAGRGLIWQVSVGGDDGIYGLDPSDGSVQQVITGSPWTDISQRGLAYDPNSDTFYIGGWNEGVIYHVAGPSWPTPGETLDQCNPPDPNISGLAWNPSFGLLWETTNSDTDTIWLVDPATCEGIRSFAHPDPGFNGAGVEIDQLGNLWTVSQGSSKAYLLDSDLPNFSDVPWLSISPTDGTVAPGDSLPMTIDVDSTGLSPGTYRALAVVLTNDPDHAQFQVAVTLVVPDYQQGINAGGAAYTDTGGDAYAQDGKYGGQGFGWVGSSAVAHTQHGIAGTDDPTLYRSQRVGMKAYRFDVANGHYKVDLRFAELQAKQKGARVFHVTLEDTPVLFNFDVFAAGGGRYVAVDRTFEVDVTDGRLDVGFYPGAGLPPIVNAILVTSIPQGAPLRT